MKNLKSNPNVDLQSPTTTSVATDIDTNIGWDLFFSPCISEDTKHCSSVKLRAGHANLKWQELMMSLPRSLNTLRQRDETHNFPSFAWAVAKELGGGGGGRNPTNTASVHFSDGLSKLQCRCW